MPEYSSISFLGASVTDVSMSVGWGENGSSLTVQLVEDTGQTFTKPDPGTPVYFTIGSVSFGGLIQRWIQQHGRGNPLYEVNVVDPREILAGAQVIVGNYEGSTLNIPNLINAYGAYPWGQAGVNDSGMPWVNILPIVANFTYQLAGYNFRLNLENLPPTPFHYRFPGTAMSLLEMIAQICDEGGVDFFVTLEQVGDEHHIVIKTRPLNQNTSAIDKIQTFVENNEDNKVEWSFGKEFRNDNISAILIGGPVNELYTTTNIAPFWGFLNGEPVVSNYEFGIDITSLGIPVLNDLYESTVDEMRAVLGGRQSWESYLTLMKPTVAANIGIDETSWNLRGIIDEPLPDNINLDKIRRYSKKKAKQLQNWIAFAQENFEEVVDSLYQFLRNYAENYYGKQFVVRIPDAEKYFDATFNEYVYSIEIADSGWKESIGYGQDPLGLSDEAEVFFRNFDGRFRAFVRFDSYTTMDVSQLSKEDYIIDGTSLYLRCDVSPVIIQNSTLYENVLGQVDPLNGVDPGEISTCAVISLPGNIGIVQRNDNFNPPLYEFPPQWGLMNIVHNELIANGYTAAESRERIGKFLSDAGMLGNNFPAAPTSLIPSAAAIPILSNVQVYGPWTAYQTGTTGKTVFLEDASLTPWEYGGQAAMNIAGNDRVVRAVATLQSVETGTIVLAGLPIRNLGDLLLDNGPVVTAIDVEYGVQGVKTTYRCQQYTPQFGDFGSIRSQRLKRLGLRMNQVSSYLKQAARPHGAFANMYYSTFKGIRTPYGGFFDTASIVNAPSLDSFIGRKGSNRVAMNTMDLVLKNSNAGASGEYLKTGGMSMNGLYRVISTNPNDTNFPHFIEPEEGATEPTVNELNPYQSGCDVQILSGTGTDSDGNIVSDYVANNARPIVFRAPMVLAGWGYDTSNNPVPNDDPNYPDSASTDFASGYLTNSQDWKCGPVDIRWDESRALWVAGSQSVTLAVVVAISGYFPSGASTWHAINSPGPPRYVCRNVTGIDGNGNVRYVPTFAEGGSQHYIPMFGSGLNGGVYSGITATDQYVLNIQEARNDVHTLGPGACVHLYTRDGFTYMSEVPRTFSRRPYFNE